VKSKGRALLPVAILALLAKPPPAWGRFAEHSCKNAFTVDQELQMGRAAKVLVYENLPVLDEADQVTEYLEALGNSLTPKAPGYQWPYEFHVVNAKDLNAFALPGGGIYVNLGTIQAAGTEAQLAGVLAHEIAHVVQRHATCNQTKQHIRATWWEVAKIGAGVALPGAGGVATQVGIGVLEGEMGLRMSREDEREADLMGADILYDSGYDARALPQFFEIVESRYGKGGSRLLSDHPNPGNRIRYVNDEIDALPHRNSFLEASLDFREVKKVVVDMHSYSEQEIELGTWRRKRANEAPSGIVAPQSRGCEPDADRGNWTDVAYGGSHWLRPANWRVLDGPGESLIVAPESVDAQNGKSMECGMRIEIFQPHQASGLAGSTEQLLRFLGEDHHGFQAVSAMTDRVVNKLPAKSIEVRVPPSAGQKGAQREWIVAMARPDGTLTYLVFAAPEERFEKLKATFEAILRSFHLG
jgi:hypothetical protein